MQTSRVLLAQNSLEKTVVNKQFSMHFRDKSFFLLLINNNIPLKGGKQIYYTIFVCFEKYLLHLYLSIYVIWNLLRMFFKGK